jgi:hypothetical protein
MRRFILILMAIGTLSAPAFAQQSVVAKYRSQFPTPMSADQILALEKAVASEVHGGLLVKRDGSNCGGYSCDIVCFSDSSLFDILGDAEGAGTPQWNATTNPRGYHCELQQPAPPPPPPPATPDLGTRLAALEQRVATLEAKTPAPPVVTTPPPPASDVSADVKRIRELLELVAKRFGLQ